MYFKSLSKLLKAKKKKNKEGKQNADRKKQNADQEDWLHNYNKSIIDFKLDNNSTKT